MRTLKKALCVVLCLVMMAGLCVIGTTAAFDDADKINYKEAVDVLTGIGVINGMGDGTFAPQGTLTRAQAAKIVVFLLKEDDLKATCNFTDCAGHWAENFIAVCAGKGIVNGYDETTFGPEDTLTGSQFAKMLLCALGYNAANEGMTGPDWEIGVGTLVKKTKLAAGIKGFDGTKEITREEACQLAFNALFTEEVAYASGGTTISTGDVTITTGASAAAGIGEYLAELFDLVDTTDTAAADAYNHAVAQQWTAGKPAKVIYTEYEEADWTYPNLTGEDIDKDTMIAAYAKEAGVKAADVTALLDDGSDFDYTVYPGEVYEFSASADKKTIQLINVTYYDAAQVVDVTDTADADADYKKDIELNWSGLVIHETDLSVEVKKGDWLAIPYTYGRGFDEYVYADAVIMEGVNGKMSAYNAAKGTATIGGNKLAITSEFWDVDGAVYGKDFASTLTYYLEPNGMLLVAEVYEEAFEYDELIGYALFEQSRAYAGGSASDLLGGGGSDAKEGRAVLQILGLDGSVTTYDIAVKQDAKNEKTTYVGKDSALTGEVADKSKTAVDEFVTYYVNDDGTIVVTGFIAPSSVTTTKAGVTVNGQKANSNTVLHIVHEKGADGKYAVETITGYKNFVNATYTDAYMVVDKGYITDIYAVNVPATPVVIVPTLGYCKSIGDETADGTEVTFVVDGKDVTYVEKSALVEAKKYYELTVEDGVVTAATEATPDVAGAVVSTVDQGYVDTDAGVIEFLKNTKTYDISGKSLTLAKGVKIDVFELSADDMIIFIIGK